MDGSGAQVGVALDGGRATAAWMVGAFLVVFLLTRTITRLIRSGRGPFRDTAVGGVHVHHLVYGIFLMLLAGAGEFAYRPDGVVQVVLAVAFGAGAALTLDEFALWLRLADVYWQREGRLSVDTVLVVGAVGVLVVLGADPLGAREGEGAGALVVSVVAVLALAAVTMAKGKVAMGVIGLFVPLVSLIGATRLAVPGSLWARRFYRPGSAREVRSRARFPPGRRTRWDALADAVGGVRRS